MLITISENLSVQRFSNPHSTQWSCFGHFDRCDSHKHQTWKKLTGLMSTDEMHHWLDTHFPDNDHADRFRSLPQQ